MSDYLGRILIPTPPSSGTTWPLISDFGYGYEQSYPIVTHRFGELATLATQRFLAGIGPRKFHFKKAVLSRADRKRLVDFFEATQGAYQTFTYLSPKADKTTESVTVIFEAVPLSIDELVNHAQVGLIFTECSASGVTYTSSGPALLRFPDSALSAALLDQVQQIIPLVHIRPRECDRDTSPLTDNIFLSDRRCTVDGQLYLPRLLELGDPGSGVIMSQSIDGAADNVQFTFGNADRVMTKLANDTDLSWAAISLDLFHVQTSKRVQLWKGSIIPGGWTSDGSAQFPVQASDGLYQINQLYPPKVISRQCWKTFNDGVHCPYATEGTGGDPAVCDYYFSSPNGCVAHGMSPARDGKAYFGGHPAQPQGVAVKDNSTGMWGMGRNTVTATSIISDTMWGKALPQIWCNDHDDAGRALIAEAMVIAGRDEDTFYDALGIIGEGPIGKFTVDDPLTNTSRYGGIAYTNADGYTYIVAPTLDGQWPHGLKVIDSNKIDGNSTTLGVRYSYGNDPSIDTTLTSSALHPFPDAFSLGRVSGSNQSTYDPAWAAGTAFVEIRRTDAKGIQPSTVDGHQIQVPISKGLSGIVMEPSGAYTYEPGVTNPFWVAVNCFLRATGLPSSSMPFVLSSLVTGTGAGTAEIADALVDTLVGSGKEKQFEFQGILAQQKPFRDWLTEILNCALGFYTFEYGNLKLGCRINATPTSAFTLGNILFQSLTLRPIQPKFEKLTIEFADPAYQYQTNTAEYSDRDHAKYYGRAGTPLSSNMHLVGCGSLSQALRVAMTRTREEVGGVIPAEWTAARTAIFKTTILALGTEAGQVVSITHPDMPGGLGSLRIQSWTLHKDWSVTIEAQSVTASMYDRDSGPNVLEVSPDPLPVMFYDQPKGPAWGPLQVQANSSDALFPGEWTFALEQSYSVLADGTAKASASVTGKEPIDKFLAGSGAPTITQGKVVVATTGGQLPGGKVYRVAVAASTGSQLSPASRIILVQTPVGTNTNKITIEGIAWPAVSGFTQAITYVSDDDALICGQQIDTLTEGSGASYTPTTLSIAGPFSRMTLGLPNPKIAKVRIKSKRLVHGGVLGAEISGLATNKIISSNCIDGHIPANNWAGRALALIGRPGSSAPYQHYLITSFNPITGEFTCNRATTDAQAGDAFVVCTLGVDNSSNPFIISDPGLSNSLNTDVDGNPTPYSGLTPSDPLEKGLIIRVIAGLSRGSTAKVTDNSATSYTLDSPLPIDATSVWIVENPAWESPIDSTFSGNSDPYLSTTLELQTSNYLKKSMLVGGFTVDIDGVETPEKYATVRMSYIWGAQGTELTVS